MSEKSESKLGWLAKYGVPSLALSVAVFVFQQQQQVFDRVQRITADGWQFYSNGRSELQYAGDVEDELALLKVIGYAFPNIYCDVRRDIYERAWSAVPPEPMLVPAQVMPPPAAGATAQLTTLAAVPGRAPDGRRYIQQQQLDGLKVALETRGSSNRPDQPGNLIEAWFPEKEAKPCPALDTATGAAPIPDPNASAAAGAANPAPADSKEVKPADTAPAPPPPAPSAAETRAAEPAPSSGAAGAPGSSAGPVEPAPPPQVVVSTQAPVVAVPQAKMKQAARELHVYFHIRNTGLRDASVAEGSRLVLSAYNFRVIRTVARIPADRGFPAEPEIRYYSADQRRDAEQLAEYLAVQFQAEGLKFRLREIGKDFPKMNPQNVEVWLPDPS